MFLCLLLLSPFYTANVIIYLTSCALYYAYTFSNLFVFILSLECLVFLHIVWRSLQLCVPLMANQNVPCGIKCLIILTAFYCICGIKWNIDFCYYYPSSIFVDCTVNLKKHYKKHLYSNSGTRTNKIGKYLICEDEIHSLLSDKILIGLHMGQLFHCFHFSLGTFSMKTLMTKHQPDCQAESISILSTMTNGPF